MNLQVHLLTRIVATAALCLLVIAAYLLWHSHHQAELATRQTAESVGGLLESQSRLLHAGLGLGGVFPDFEVWKQSGAQPGVCLLYSAADPARSRSLCIGSKPVAADWPPAFAAGYRLLFQPGAEVRRAIALADRNYGSLTVTPSAELEIAAAWQQTASLMALSTVTVLAVCLLVYLSIRRALRPAAAVVSGLAELAAGRLAYRLPAFELDEWRQIAAAVNRLAAGQQQLQAERRRLIVQLIDLQEAERRHLATELHDELGQCLAAINAYTASLKQTAAQQCPQLLDELEHIGRITAHMLDGVRNLLGRLRPAEFDELGLAASLDSLVAGWNARSAGRTRYRLHIAGDCGLLSAAQAMTLFRIAQECLTNAAKHAQAANVGIELTVGPRTAVLTVSDDGIAAQLPFADSFGIGLPGMRERAAALHGRLHLAIVPPHGLRVETRLPLAGAAAA